MNNVHQNTGNIVPETLEVLLNSTLVKATDLLTSDATNPDAGGTLTIGGVEYTLVESLTAAVEAEADLTTDETEVADGTLVVVGSRTYTIVEELPAYDPYDSAIYVAMGADADETLENLVDAINGDSAAWGVTHSRNNSPHPDVTAGAVTSHTTTITALVAGTDGNTIALTSSDEHLVAESATLTGGVDTVPNEILIGANAAATLDNIKSAVNATAGAGTTYSLGTVANPYFEATTNTDTTQLFVARVGGTASDIAPSEDATHLSFGSPVAGGGTVGRATISEGGLATRIVTKCPQLTGTPTYGWTLKTADGIQIASASSLAENSTVVTPLVATYFTPVMIPAGSILEITASGTVEDTLPIEVTVL
jgi:hypothetical protein